MKRVLVDDWLVSYPAQNPSPSPTAGNNSTANVCPEYFKGDLEAHLNLPEIPQYHVLQFSPAEPFALSPSLADLQELNDILDSLWNKTLPPDEPIIMPVTAAHQLAPPSAQSP